MRGSVTQGKPDGLYRLSECYQDMAALSKLKDSILDLIDGIIVWAYVYVSTCTPLAVCILCVCDCNCNIAWLCMDFLPFIPTLHLYLASVELCAVVVAADSRVELEPAQIIIRRIENRQLVTHTRI